MSGTYGYDGYIYQANVTLYTVLLKILNREGLDKFIIELRKPDETDARSDEFTVDLLVYTSSSDRTNEKCDVTEIKGGNQTNLVLDEIRNNLTSCSGLLRQQNPSLIITQKLILRKQETQIVIDGVFIEEIKDDLDPVTEPFSTLENDIQKIIKKILEEFIGTEKPEYYSRIIFYSLRHLIEFKIKKLAWTLRNSTNGEVLEKAETTAEELFNHYESFTHTLQNNNRIDRAVALDRLSKFNTMKGAEFPTTSDTETQTNLTDSGANI